MMHGLNKVFTKEMRTKSRVSEWPLSWMNATVPPQTQKTLNSFPTVLWYGLQATPIFKENKRQQVGDLAQTTQQQYGNRLHEVYSQGSHP